MFQFQNGAIISICGLYFGSRFDLVSIPKWCDYKQVFSSDKQKTKLFQFQNGAIIRLLSSFILTLPSKFQFQNGAIIRTFESHDETEVEMFQFQNGAIISPDLKNIFPWLLCFNSKMVRL